MTANEPWGIRVAEGGLLEVILVQQISTSRYADQ
jgi:hypothetical protein